MKNKSGKSKKFNFSFDHIFSNNRVVTVFSILIALVIWVWVAIEKSPEIQTVITSVPVKINLEDSIPQQLNLQIFGKSEFTVDVTVTGKKYVVSELDVDDILIEANINYVNSPGMKTLQLKVTPANDSEEFSITSVSSTYIEVFFDTYKEAEFSINGEIKTELDTIAPKDCIVGDIVFSKNTVKISGPTSEINKITSVYASVNVDEVLNTTTTFDPELTLVTNDGTKLEYSKMAVDASEITMTVPILKIVTLPTVIEFKNAPSYYIENPLDYTIYPTSVKVAVPVEALETTKHFVVQTIDFADIINKNNTFNINVKDINSFKIVDESIKQFKIKINASKLEIKTIVVPSSKIVLKNERNDFNVELDTNREFSITIIGPSEEVNSITADNIIIELDTADKLLSPDVKTILARVVVNNTETCWAYGKYDVRVKVTPK